MGRPLHDRPASSLKLRWGPSVSWPETPLSGMFSCSLAHLMGNCSGLWALCTCHLCEAGCLPSPHHTHIFHCSCPSPLTLYLSPANWGLLAKGFCSVLQPQSLTHSSGFLKVNTIGHLLCTMHFSRNASFISQTTYELSSL